MKNNFYRTIGNIFIPAFYFLFCFDVADAQTRLIGSAARGGDGFGTVYNIIPGSTSFANLIKIEGISGINPSTNRLTQGTNGKFYGTASSGGITNGDGVIYEYDIATNKYTNKIDLAYATGVTPEGSLTPLSAGKFLGHTSYGGANDAGVIFEYDYITNTYTDKIDLLTADGAYPLADLVQASNGKFYGITLLGGANNLGVIYEYDHATNTYTKKIDMTDVGGNQSAYTMVEAPNGKFYGTTYDGGANAAGVIFEYDFTNNIYTSKIDMTVAGGRFPVGSLFLAPNGKFYGTTRAGGNAGRGVIFEYDYLTNTYTKKFDFTTAANGSSARGPLMMASDGKLYGVTAAGGANNDGVLFQYDYLTNSYTKKFDLVNLEGSSCICGLAEGTNGKLYATSNLGGYANSGVLFEYDFTNNIYTKKKDFGLAGDGSNFFGPPVKADNGKIYFLSYDGGNYGDGAIIEYDYVADTYTKKADLSGSNGAFAYGGLTQASNGKLYGMTTKGGATDEGVIFEFDYSTNIITNKKDLGGVDGSIPYGTMLLAGNGKLYGTAQSGGAFGLGVLFEYDYSTDTYTKKIDFSAINGRTPTNELFEASNGKIYGSTTMGDVGLYGSIFEYDYNTNSFTTKLFLNGTGGESISGAFVEDPNGKLYGTTAYGGTFGKGVIFEYDFNSNIYTKKIDLALADGSYPRGLVRSQNGKYYGVTQFGGTINNGVFFEYDQTTNTYTKKINFDNNNGMWPSAPPVEVDLGIVPISLFDFKATRSGKDALLTWKTGSEMTNRYIDVERSSDGGSFSFLNRINGAGNTGSDNSYHFTDTKVFPSKNYYRVKLVGMDGRSQYSDTKMVDFTRDEPVVIYPNPMQSQLNISFEGSWLDQPVKLSLYNQLGQQLWSKQTDHVKQIEQFLINKLSNGFYLLKLEQPKSATIYRKIQVVN